MVNIRVGSDIEGEPTGIDVALLTTDYVLTNFGKLDGTTIYQIISDFDDMLAERPPEDKSVKGFIDHLEYHSGGTLRLVPPVFLAYGLDNEKLMDVYRRITKLYPGAVEGGRDIQKALRIPIHYITSTWENGAAGIMEPLGVPAKRVHASPLNLGRYTLTDSEKALIRKSAEELNAIASSITDKSKELQMDGSVKSFEDFDPRRKERFWKLKKIFIDRLGSMPEIMRLYEEVRIVDAGQKAAIFRKYVKKPGYTSVAIGDSSTDVVMLKQVRDDEDIAIAHNAKKVAIDAANFALGTKNYYITAPILGIADRRGKRGLIEVANNWSFNSLIEYMKKCALPRKVIATTEEIFGYGRTEFPRFVYLPSLSSQDREEFVQWSSNLRSELRGTETAIIR
jgi:predicted HAD superfamily phosphohydrolase